MNIKGVYPMIPTHSQLSIGDKSESKNYTNLNFTGNIKQTNNDLQFVITMNIDIDLVVDKQIRHIKTVHQFEVMLGEHNIKFTSDNDYWDVASLVQISIAQARVFLLQELQRLQLPILLIPIDPLQRIYQFVKEGNYSLWN